MLFFYQAQIHPMPEWSRSHAPLPCEVEKNGKQRWQAIGWLFCPIWGLMLPDKNN